MKNPVRLLLVIAMVSTAAPAAFAYQLSPPNITSQLKGRLTFTPNEGGTPFKCKITMILKTKGFIKSVIVDGPGGCGLLEFQGLPWHFNFANANSGNFGSTGFTDASGNCHQNSEQFQDNSSGVWTLTTGQCMSGTLTSHPPVTIAP